MASSAPLTSSSPSNNDPAPHPHHLSDRLEPLTFETVSDSTVTSDPNGAGEREKELEREEKATGAGGAGAAADDYPDGGLRAWRYVLRLFF
jgi:hypothetical protein